MRGIKKKFVRSSRKLVQGMGVFFSLAIVMANMPVISVNALESTYQLKAVVDQTLELEGITIKTLVPTMTPTPSISKSEVILKSESTYDSITELENQISTDAAVNLTIPTESNNARYQYLFGTNYKAFTMSNPPEGYESASSAAKNMTTITVPVWKMNSSGKKYKSTYSLTINKLLADNVADIFDEIFALDIKFPIKVLVGYRYRKVGGVGLSNSTLMSIHSFGAAIDINLGDYDNDYYLGAGNDLRDKTNPYCIPDEVIEIFEKYGWFWGGDFSICSDTMHFQYLGLDFLSYQGNSPFRTLKVTASSNMTGKDVLNLQKRLKKLGFSVSADGIYGNGTANAVKKAQKQYGLSVTGVVDYKTWEKIINLTHDMAYVF